MSELYLIAHRVRGEAAFDIAERAECPECAGGGVKAWCDHEVDCSECDSLGFWWIIPTSGHRAYPYWYIDLADVIPTELIWEGDYSNYDSRDCLNTALTRIALPDPWPDHYPTRSSPKSNPSSGKSLLAALGLIPKVVRRL